MFRCDLGLEVLAARAAVVVVVHAAFAVSMASTGFAEDPLRLEAKIPLGVVAGRLDHLAVDVARMRIYVAELGNDSLAVVDLKARAVVRTIAGLKEPQGVAYVPAVDAIYIANGGDGTVAIFKGADLSVAGAVRLDGDADNMRVDPLTGRLFVGHGAGGIAVIDPATGKEIGDIGLPGHPESFEIASDGTGVFVNVPDAHEIAVVDPRAGRAIAHWRQSDAANFAMAIDPAGKRIIAAFRSPAVIRAIAMSDGTEGATARSCGDVDDLFVDPRRARLYVICGVGAIDVVALRAGGFEPTGQLPTAAGARTGLFVPELDRLFVAVPARNGAGAALWIYAPSP